MQNWVYSLFAVLCAIALLLGAYNSKKLWEQVDIFKLKFKHTDETTSKQRKDLDAFIKAYYLEREVFLERLHELSDEFEHIRTAFDIYGSEYEEDRKAIGQELAIVKEKFAETAVKFEDSLSTLKEVLDDIKDSAIERNNEEARMFQGISNMMNYDISQATKAAKGGED